MDLFVQFVYQPFFNILVLFYWALGRTSTGYDMGVAVILLTILIRIILLPLTILGHRSEKERREIEVKVKQVQQQFAGDPLLLQQETKVVLRSKPRIILAEGFMFLVQLVIALILYRIFTTGLEGEDLHLLYSWIPTVPQPYNLMFLGRFDLSRSNVWLNLLQSLVIFVLEAAALMTSPYPTSRQEIFRVQLTLPIVSFMVFAFLPAGKKVFIITTLLFSLLVVIIRQTVYLYHKLFPEPEPEAEKPLQYVVVPESMMAQIKKDQSGSNSHQ